MGVNMQFSSLTAYSGDILINVVIMLLIVIGGIGFLTWEDIINKKWHITKRSEKFKKTSVEGDLCHGET